MKKIAFSLAAMTVLSFSFATQSQANPQVSHTRTVVVHQRTVVHTHTNYHVTHGVRFQHGYLYKGRYHSHWRYTRYDPRDRCICYYDPCCSTWYYWCAPDSCFYPVSYRPYRTYCWGNDSIRVAVSPTAPQGPIGPGPLSTDNGPAIPAPIGPPGE